jgi:Spy/CpxP family protein refolding chaperone
MAVCLDRRHVQLFQNGFLRKKEDFMKRATNTMVSCSVAAVCMLALAVPGSWANDPSYGHAGGHGGHGEMGGYGKGMMHSGTGHLIRHLLKHEKDIGLTADQTAKLKDLQLSLDKVRIKTEAEIQIAERELKALTDDDKSDLAAIETKLKQSEDRQVSLRMTAIKMRRDVMAVLTPEQREKEQTEHDKMMRQHKEGGMGHGTPHGGGMPYGANPHGKNPHAGYGENAPSSPPSNMSVQ